MKRPSVIKLIHQERRRQIKMYGTKSHSDLEWLSILAEEFGEVGKAICEHYLQKGKVSVNEVKNELVQVAAVCVAWLEDRF